MHINLSKFKPYVWQQIISSSPRVVRQNIEGYLLISPWLIGFILLTLGPIIFTVLMSFTDWDIVSEARYVGFDNYTRILTQDKLFRQAVYNTVFYIAISVPLSLLLALFLALLLNQDLPGTKFWTTAFYLPSIVSVVAMGILWKWILIPRAGILNYLLSLIGISGPAWLGSPVWSKPALILVSLMYVGPQTIIFLAGLKGIPQVLYDSAELDGAGPLTKFRYVTLPMLSSVLFFNLVTAVIHASQVFALVFAMFTGISRGSAGPMNSTLVYLLYLYEKAFRQLNMGYASALAWLMFIVVLAITLLQLRYSSWVYYERGSKQ